MSGDPSVRPSSMLRSSILPDQVTRGCVLLGSNFLPDLPVLSEDQQDEENLQDQNRDHQFAEAIDLSFQLSSRHRGIVRRIGIWRIRILGGLPIWHGWLRGAGRCGYKRLSAFGAIGGLFGNIGSAIPTFLQCTHLKEKCLKPSVSARSSMRSTMEPYKNGTIINSIKCGASELDPGKA